MVINTRGAKSTVLILAIILSILSINSCKNINIYPTSEDIKIGKQLDKQIRADTKEYPIYPNQVAKRYVTEILNAILQSPDIKYRSVFQYQIEIIKNDDIVNAFAAPGGYIYVYTGLLKFVDNEATLAAIIAHEIAHVENRHTTSRMTKQLGLQALQNVALGDNPDKNTQLLANLFTGLGLLQNSRSDELEADADAFKYLKVTKWYPGAMTYFFDKVKGTMKVGGGGYLTQLLSTHPMPQDRVEAVIKLLKENNIPPPTERNLFGRSYQEFKASLK
jgi:predicted Zn-dependent protease